MTGVQTCALPIRSEEHTSELQSHDNLVCRLLPGKNQTRGRLRPPLPREGDEPVNVIFHARRVRIVTGEMAGRSRPQQDDLYGSEFFFLHPPPPDNPLLRPRPPALPA